MTAPTGPTASTCPSESTTMVLASRVTSGTEWLTYTIGTRVSSRSRSM
jgi:hypothetical protein